MEAWQIDVVDMWDIDIISTKTTGLVVWVTFGLLFHRCFRGVETSDQN
jgi:hypothetical protein